MEASTGTLSSCLACLGARWLEQGEGNLQPERFELRSQATPPPPPKKMVWPSWMVNGDMGRQPWSQNIKNVLLSAFFYLLKVGLVSGFWGVGSQLVCLLQSIESWPIVLLLGLRSQLVCLLLSIESWPIVWLLGCRVTTCLPSSIYRKLDYCLASGV